MAPFFTGIAKNLGGTGFGRLSGGPSAFSATGGTVTTAGGKTIHTFTALGDFIVTSGNDNVEYLVVAGGGSGGPGNYHGPGGGAGGYRTGTGLPVSPGPYSITVGGGGGGTNGSPSVFSTITE